MLPASDIDRSDQPKTLLERFFEKFSKAPSPEVAAQLKALDRSRFREPELHQFTEVRGEGVSVLF